jgi:hypothetical protein
MTVRRGAVASNRDELTESCEQAGFLSAIDARREATPIAPFPVHRGATASSPARGPELSNRAMNVLKILAAEMTGECPPRQRWTPSPALLREITYKHLVTTRNCGPRTISEIVRWAQSQGVTIRPPYHAGKSLAETWKAISAKSTAGELVFAEIAEALEKSVRRKNTTIPVEIQKLLLQLLKPDGGQAPA